MHPIELRPLSHGAPGFSPRASAHCIHRGQLEVVQEEARGITKDEEDDLLGEMEGTEGQCLCEEKQEPLINPGDGLQPG